MLVLCGRTISQNSSQKFRSLSHLTTARHEQISVSSTTVSRSASGSGRRCCQACCTGEGTLRSNCAVLLRYTCRLCTQQLSATPSIASSELWGLRGSFLTAAAIAPNKAWGSAAGLWLRRNGAGCQGAAAAGAAAAAGTALRRGPAVGAPCTCTRRN
jgi:hypothetical protein